MRTSKTAKIIIKRLGIDLLPSVYFMKLGLMQVIQILFKFGVLAPAGFNIKLQVHYGISTVFFSDSILSLSLL